MKENEARDLISMMASATSGGTQLELDKEAFWIEQLEHMDADQATEAVLMGIRSWDFFPSWKQFAQAFTDVGRRRVAEQELAERTGEYEQRQKQPKRVPPFWIKRWVAARFLFSRFGKERDERRFTEQGMLADPAYELMPEDAWVEEAQQISDAEVWRNVREFAQSASTATVGGTDG